jgi:hypothetical protein
VSTTEERKHALTRLYELCWIVIFAVLLDVISLACTSGRVPIAHLISEKALGLRVHVGIGQTDLRASYGETNGHFRLRDMHRLCESCA